MWVRCDFLKKGLYNYRDTSKFDPTLKNIRAAGSSSEIDDSERTRNSLPQSAVTTTFFLRRRRTHLWRTASDKSYLRG